MTSSMSNRLNQPRKAHDLIPSHCIHEIKKKGYVVSRGGSRGRVQGVRTPP